MKDNLHAGILDLAKEAKADAREQQDAGPHQATKQQDAPRLNNN